jgi:hypothetical protein
MQLLQQQQQRQQQRQGISSSSRSRVYRSLQASAQGPWPCLPAVQHTASSWQQHRPLLLLLLLLLLPAWGCSSRRLPAAVWG